MNTTTSIPSLDKIKENWNDYAKKLQAKFPKLTDVDLEFKNGKEEDLLKRLETKLEKKRDEVVTILEEIQN